MEIDQRSNARQFLQQDESSSLVTSGGLDALGDRTTDGKKIHKRGVVGELQITA